MSAPQRVKQLPPVGVITEAMVVRCRWKRRQAPTTENRTPPSPTSAVPTAHMGCISPSLPASLPRPAPVHVPLHTSGMCGAHSK